jgi:precorrin-6A synthase
MKKIFIIGIGAGNPDYITMQAVKALNQVDVFFLLDKGKEKTKLIELRKEICRRYVRKSNYRVVEAESPAWPRGTPDYRKTVDHLNRDKQALFEHLIFGELADGECGAFLAWGDPTLYDSTIRIIGTIAASHPDQLDYEVIPGITSVQALAARHKTTLNRIARPVEITTGRRIAEGFPDHADSVVVVLDAGNAYAKFADQDIDIYWGAYVGTADEILISGKLKDVADDILRIRAEARRANGWIMDTYIMRRAGEGAPTDAQNSVDCE